MTAPADPTKKQEEIVPPVPAAQPNLPNNDTSAGTSAYTAKIDESVNQPASVSEPGPVIPAVTDTPTSTAAPVMAESLAPADSLPPLPANPAVEVTPTPSPVPASIPQVTETVAPVETDTDSEEEKDEPQVVERVIIKEKNGGIGCFGFVKNLTCFVISMILLLIAAVVAIIIFRPAFITEPLKIFINGDYKPQDVATGTSADSVKSYIEEVTNAEEGEVTFQMTEDQLTTLVRERFEDNVDVRVGLDENKLQLFTDIAQQGEPLWLIVELNDSGDSLVFSRIGFGRINTPPSLRDFVRDRAFGLLGSVIKDFNFDKSETLASNLVGGELREGVTIKEVKFAPDLMLVTVEL